MTWNGLNNSTQVYHVADNTSSITYSSPSLARDGQGNILMSDSIAIPDEIEPWDQQPGIQQTGGPNFQGFPNTRVQPGTKLPYEDEYILGYEQQIRPVGERRAQTIPAPDGGASGMAWSDINEFARSPHFQLVAVPTATGTNWS